MNKRKLIIKNHLGLHARPAAIFVQMAAKFQSDIQLVKDGFEVNGKSILSVLMLAAEKGCEIFLKTSGPDEIEAMETLASFLEGKMDEFQAPTT
jgi:phosphocarrier protein HPr